MKTAVKRIMTVILMMFVLVGCGKEDARSVLLEDETEEVQKSADEEKDQGDKDKNQGQETPAATPTQTPQETPVIQVTVHCDCECGDGTCQVAAEGAAVVPGEDVPAENPAGADAENGNSTLEQSTSATTPQVTAAAGLTSEGKVNINTADETTLQTLNGIGQARAQSIIAYRQSNGPFQSIEEIMNIDGIADGIFNKIKEDISVG